MGRSPLRSGLAGVAAALAMLIAPACTETLVVSDDSPAEIGLSPVTNVAVKSLPGAMDGPSFDELETIGIFAWYKGTDSPQSWQDFYNDGTPGPGEIYIDNAPFAKLGDNWAGGYNDLNISFERGTGESIRSVTMKASVRKTTHQPKYWPRTGHLAFAGYSPYYRFEAIPGTDRDKYQYYTTRTRLCENDPDDQADDTQVSINTDDPAHPYIQIANLKQGRFHWITDNHWPVNETFDLMWFDVDENKTANPGISGTPAPFPVRFHHACARVDFRFRAKNAESDGKFVLLKAELDNMYWSGDFSSDVGNGNAGWADLKYAEPTGTGSEGNIVLFDYEGDNNDPTDVFNHVTAQNYLELKDMMLIPQPVDKGGGKVSVLTLRYKQLTSDSGKPLTEVYTCRLTASEGGVWEMGKHYIYDIVFGLDKISVEPTVAKWDESSGTVNPGN